MSPLERLAEGPPRIFLSLTSPERSDQQAFVASLMSAIASHDMTPVRVTGGLSAPPLESIRQVMQTCQGTIVVAMARNRVVEGLDYFGGEDGQGYRHRYLATEWVQIESALAYQLGHPILVLREDLVFPTGLLDPDASGFPVCTFSLREGAAHGVARIARELLAFRARLGSDPDSACEGVGKARPALPDLKSQPELTDSR
jgi:hypothetical protein